ncbi:MAG: DUF1330 domain-containing protein [Reyranella sp.]|uniref:DUF1330 domain-containing protein n=1 Tax=Reyranella sp. TaxID=1929291 RepID=UPI001AD0B4E6|nr:DUF1330 domain-containing protein [Reyranella sp.]MBN9090422.1 DUF1330 domain-containing protein [Reyranella sp.]
MSAYLMVHMTVSDPEQYQVYAKAVVPLIETHGGRFTIRGGKVETLEGKHDGRRMVVFEFPSMEALKGFWNSPEYIPVKKLRENAAVLDVWAVEGI